MITQTDKENFEKLNLPYPAVAIKFRYARPESVEKLDRVVSFCQFLSIAQNEKKHFYVTVENDDCCGKIAVGMIPKPGFEASGTVGVDFQCFATEAPNARLHNTYPTLVQGSVNYIEYCPLSSCDFEPDLVICVADNASAGILMRASSYYSGDLWEAKTSFVMSCAWTYVYPYLSGKVNYHITGLHHGLKRRHLYPAGLLIITIPYQKLLEVKTALNEMPWTPIALREDDESKETVRTLKAKWAEMIKSESKK